jgi:hypothetical protein
VYLFFSFIVIDTTRIRQPKKDKQQRINQTSQDINNEDLNVREILQLYNESSVNNH